MQPATPVPPPGSSEPPAPRPVEVPETLPWHRTRWGGPAIAVGAFAAWFAGSQATATLILSDLRAVPAGETEPAAHPPAVHVRHLPAILAAGAVAAIVLVTVLKIAGWLADRPRGPERGRIAKTVAWTAALAFACIAGQRALLALFAAAGHAIDEQPWLVHAFRELGTTFGTALWCAFVVAAPVAEELVFRRVGFVHLLATNGRAVAYVLSTALFALAHMHPPAFLNYLWVGLCCAYVLERTGSAGAAVLVHVANNASSLAARP